MSGGSTTSTQGYNPQMSFNPHISGGSISIGGGVGSGSATFGGDTSSSGPSVGVNANVNMAGQPGEKKLLVLMNLDSVVNNITNEKHHDSSSEFIHNGLHIKGNYHNFVDNQNMGFQRIGAILL